MKKREKIKKKRKKRKVSLLVKLLLTAAICTGVYFFASSSFFNVTSFEVSGNSYYSEDEILTMGNCKTGGNIFGAADVRR